MAFLEAVADQGCVDVSEVDFRALADKFLRPQATLRAKLWQQCKMVADHQRKPLDGAARRRGAGCFRLAGLPQSYHSGVDACSGARCTPRPVAPVDPLFRAGVTYSSRICQTQFTIIIARNTVVSRRPGLWLRVGRLRFERGRRPGAGAGGRALRARAAGGRGGGGARRSRRCLFNGPDARAMLVVLSLAARAP